MWTPPTASRSAWIRAGCICGSRTPSRSSAFTPKLRRVTRPNRWPRVSKRRCEGTAAEDHDSVRVNHRRENRAEVLPDVSGHDALPCSGRRDAVGLIRRLDACHARQEKRHKVGVELGCEVREDGREPAEMHLAQFGWDHHPDNQQPDAGVTRARSFDDRSDRKSTRLNSSHVAISYAVFCLKKK